VNEEEGTTLLREIAERLKSVERRLDTMEAASQEASKAYETTDALYREKLAAYKDCKHCVPVGVAVFSLILLLLIYISYRVS
jgi:hypothetical protein